MFKKAAVLGAGVMGSQIAAHLANIGLTVYLLDLPAGDRHKNELVETAFKKTLKLNPPPLFSEKNIHRVILGNFEEDWYRLGEVDWAIEAIVENLPLKQDLMTKIESAIGDSTIVSTNTSGLSVNEIARGRSESFRKRFLGTHFFNPPRYMKLLELIPTQDTDPTTVQLVTDFAKIRLGKGVVIAKDTPNFIANRIGVYVTMLGLKAFIDGDYTIEEIDTLAGTLIGRPKSAIFRTADLVGLDTLLYVAKNLYPAIPEDESKEIFRVPELLIKLVEMGALGAKTGKGFYKKEKERILSLNPATLNYEAAKPLNLGDIKAIASLPKLQDRLLALNKDPGRAGAFFRAQNQAMLQYAIARLSEIAETPSDIDRAMQWGFGWELGPFQLGNLLNWTTITPAALPSPPTFIVWQNPEAALLDLGDRVGLYEFRSKGNTLTMKVIEGLNEVLDLVERENWRGLVIGNYSANFSGGANLGEMAMLAELGGDEAIANLIVKFQQLLQRMRYFSKPIVAAIQGKVLGGGCEFVMACPYLVAAAETYIGLVELSVGLIPGAGGITRMVAMASDRAATPAANDIQPFLLSTFKTIAMAKVSTSAYEAQELGFLPSNTTIAIDGERRIDLAKQKVLSLDYAGYAPPPEARNIVVLGRAGRAMLQYAADVFHQGRYISDYDLYLANRLAYVMTGGELSVPSVVSEEYLLQLEKENFIPLLRQEKTRARIAHLLQTKKPLRN
jgi:3-hydroxyacyl-CoA dehydrogenase